MNFVAVYWCFHVKMAIQCGICKNIMPSSSFLTHKERKHSMLENVPYVKLSENVLKSDLECGPLVKCRFCPNRIPANAMQRHLQRSHIECQWCNKILLKSNYDKHMQQKHATNLSSLTDLSQSKSSIQSDCDLIATPIDSASDSSSPVPFSMQTSTTNHSTTSTSEPGNIEHVDIWQLNNYIRQGRVYTKDGCLYLRNTLNVFWNWHAIFF